jgi:hypothetical protein
VVARFFHCICSVLTLNASVAGIFLLATRADFPTANSFAWLWFFVSAVSRLPRFSSCARICFSARPNFFAAESPVLGSRRGVSPVKSGRTGSFSTPKIFPLVSFLGARSAGLFIAGLAAFVSRSLPAPSRSNAGLRDRSFPSIFVRPLRFLVVVAGSDSPASFSQRRWIRFLR